jgi:hypothetical protein
MVGARRASRWIASETETSDLRPGGTYQLRPMKAPDWLAAMWGKDGVSGNLSARSDRVRGNSFLVDEACGGTTAPSDCTRPGRCSCCRSSTFEESARRLQDQVQRSAGSPLHADGTEVSRAQDVDTNHGTACAGAGPGRWSSWQPTSAGERPLGRGSLLDTVVHPGACSPGVHPSATSA